MDSGARVPLSDEQAAEIEDQFRGFARRSVTNLRKLSASSLTPNPFLIELLIRGLGYQTAEQVAWFMVNQRFERSIVTSMGTTFQRVAHIVAGEIGSGTAGADMEIQRNDVHYFVQIKSGPVTANQDIAEQISSKLQSARRRYGANALGTTAIVVLGICYGTQAGDIPRRVLQERGVEIMVGENFWTFLSGGDPTTMTAVRTIARRAIIPATGAVADILSEKVRLVIPMVQAEYGLP